MLRSAQLFLMTLLILASYCGLIFLVVRTTPDELVSRLALFAALFCAVSFTAMLVAYLLSFRLYSFRRFHGDMGRASMQAFPFGLSAVVAAWLQSMRALSWLSGLILMAVLVASAYVTLPGRR